MVLYKNGKKVFVEKHFEPPFSGPNYWLAEVYSKTNLSFIDNLLDSLILFSKNPKEYTAQFFKLELELHIGFLEVSEEDNIKNVAFDPLTGGGMIVIPIKKSQIGLLEKDKDYRKTYKKFLKSKITHEDTHKQQFDKYIGYSKNYKIPESENPFTLKSQADVDYFSQTIEADAYGREVGEILRELYPDDSIDIIFKDVINNQVLEIEEYLEAYKDPRISKKGYQHFWRALYDYLEGKEK